jgi:hypothetical protein
VDEIGPFPLQDGGDPPGGDAGRERVEASALGFERDRARAGRLDRSPVLAQAGDHGDPKAEFPRRPHHRQEVRREEPVLRDDEDERAARERGDGGGERHGSSFGAARSL